MNGFDTCRLFLALNNHFFQANYDYFRYEGAVPLKLETYEKKRQDEIRRYERLGRKFQDKEELENFIVANLLESKKRMWVGGLFGGESDEVYLRWQGRTQSLQYNLTSELRHIIEDNDGFNIVFKCEAHEHPEILKSHMRGDLSLESFVLLDMCLGFISRLELKLNDDRNWMIVREKAIKYRPFLERLNINIPSLVKVVFKVIEDTGVIT